MRRSLCSGTVHSGNRIAALRTQSRHFYPEGGSNMLNVKNPGPVDVQRHVCYTL
jgi:hypothetical protein